MPDDVSISELARQVTDAFARLTAIAARLESGQFVRTDLYQVADKANELRLKQIETDVNERISKVEYEALINRVNQLEDDKKWLIRLVLGFVVLAIVGLVVVSGGIPK